MKNQTLFSSKDKSKKIKMSSAAIFVWRFKGYVLIVHVHIKSSVPKFLLTKCKELFTPHNFPTKTGGVFACNTFEILKYLN